MTYKLNLNNITRMESIVLRHKQELQLRSYGTI